MPLPLNCLELKVAFSTDYVPVFKGATDDPSGITYTTQFGEFVLIGNLCWFTIHLKTNASGMAKTTLGDTVKVPLPFPAANVAFTHGDVRVEAAAWSATPNKVGNQGRIAVGDSYVEIWNVPASGAIPAVLTYAATGAGIGALNTTIELEVSGCYRVVM